MLIHPWASPYSLQKSVFIRVWLNVSSIQNEYLLWLFYSCTTQTRTLDKGKDTAEYDLELKLHSNLLLFKKKFLLENSCNKNYDSSVKIFSLEYSWPSETTFYTDPQTRPSAVPLNDTFFTLIKLIPFCRSQFNHILGKFRVTFKMSIYNISFKCPDTRIF